MLKTPVTLEVEIRRTVISGQARQRLPRLFQNKPGVVVHAFKSQILMRQR
jgi:hypothetical protein